MCRGHVVSKFFHFFTATTSKRVSFSQVFIPYFFLFGSFRFDLNAYALPPMGRITLTVFAFWVFISVVFLLLAGAQGNGGAERAGEESKPSFGAGLLSRVFSTSVSTSPPATVSYWDKVRALVTHVRGYFYSPNVDFRGVDETEAGEEGGAGGGGKMKEAASKSLEKGVETVEDSAKSAAKIASETVKKTKEMVKKSLLGRGSEDDDPEL